MLLKLLLNLMIIFPQGGKDSTKAKTSSEADEVTTEVLMEEVFGRFHINYEMSRTHKTGYYRETMIDKSSLCYLADGIVEIYVPSNLNDKDNAAVHSIRSRKKFFKRVKEEYVLLGNASDMARSSVWRPQTFLNRKNRHHYTYSHDKDTIYNGRKTKIVNFTTKNGDGISNGNLLVDAESLAIVKMTYRPVLSEQKTMWKSITWTESFEFRNGAYELSTVNFEGISKEGFIYEAFLAMEQLETISEIPSNLSFINRDFSIVIDEEENIEDDLKFWKGYDHFKKYVQPLKQYTARAKH